MSTELSMLTWTAGFTALLWLPYILAHIAQVGVVEALSYRHPSQPKPAWAERAKKAHYNAVENLVVFAALVLVLEISGLNSAGTATAAVIFLIARVAHFPAYIANVPFVRTGCFGIGWFALLYIFLVIVGGEPQAA